MFIFDAIAREVYLAEIKFRRRDSSREVGLRLQDLKKALKYWSDATLVVTIPVERVFYAQKLKELEDIIVRTDSGPLIDFNLERQFGKPNAEITRIAWGRRLSRKAAATYRRRHLMNQPKTSDVN